jgi:GNAT superfamily N-acetyltransferase
MQVEQPFPDSGFTGSADGWVLDLNDGLRIRATASPASPIVDEFFEAYERAFVLPDEKEDIAGFRACLVMNEDRGCSAPPSHRELIAVIEDDGGTLLGGANFLASAIQAIDGHPSTSVALNYLFVDQAARGRGLSRLLLAMVAQLSVRALGDQTGNPAIFIEQNDPLRMTAAEYEEDNERGGTDQVERLRLWQHLGARAVDFAYVQPALSADQAAEDALVYSVLGFDGPHMSARFLHDHLQSFFRISVLKGQDPTGDPTAAAQLEELSARADAGGMIDLLDIGPALETLSGDRGNWPRCGSILELARGDCG